MKDCRVVLDVMMEDDTRTIPTASDQLLHSFWIPTSSPSFHGTASASASMVNFENRRLEDEELDQKKRRLTAEQVEFLEKSFDVENKLEPHRKTQLAKQLGLQPRQVAIWFQNRRARYKTKLLEKQYDSLKSCYDKLKEDYDALFSDNQKLKNELVNLQKDGCEACSSGRSDVLESDSSGVLENDEDERLRLPKLEPHHDLDPNTCNLGFPAQNQGTWFWQY